MDIFAVVMRVAENDMFYQFRFEEPFGNVFVLQVSDQLLPVLKI